MKGPLSPSTFYKLFADGACRGNPGPAGAGVALFTPNQTPYATFSAYLGPATNMVAEFQAVIFGLQLSQALRIPRLVVCTDSKNLVDQVAGRYAVRHERLKGLHARICHLRDDFDSCQFEFVGRKNNKEADRLANRALDSEQPFQLELNSQTHFADVMRIYKDLDVKEKS